MRFRLTESISNEFDSLGNELTEKQAQFFRNSKVRDHKGNLLACHHGTDSSFDTFEKGDIGFHFGTEAAAINRREFKDNPKNWYINKYYLNITKPFVETFDYGAWDGVTIAVVWMFGTSYDGLTEYLSNGDITGDLYIPQEFSDDKSIAIIKDVVKRFAGVEDWSYYGYNDEPNIIMRKLFESKGYDGIQYANTFEDDYTDSYIAFHSNQVKTISVKTPTNSNNINESATNVDEFEEFESKCFKVASTIVKEIESKLDKYGLEIDLITDYEDYDDNFAGMFLSSQQDIASVFPIVINPKVMYNYAKENGYVNDHSFIVWAVKSTLWHEVGHGIVSYLSDIWDFDWDEEEVVEEFAIQMCDTGRFEGELADALNEFEQEYC